MFTHTIAKTSHHRPCSPVPEIRWWRESRADVEDDQLEHFGKILVLKDVDREDTGSYYCQASNEAGESDAHQFTVYVEGTLT